tara:strand:+ start:164 stop:280 length:117 start_codon:yes stop_codon:yes gene_type:complete
MEASSPFTPQLALDRSGRVDGVGNRRGSAKSSFDLLLE